jgi:predicted ATPase/transcriptional regulator with XRE-family HTH domain
VLACAPNTGEGGDVAVQALPFSEMLRRSRERSGLSQEALAERTGLTAKAISALERGERRRPYPRTLNLLATALDLTAAERATLVTLARGAPPAPPLEPAHPTADASAPVAPPLAPLPTPLTSHIGRDSERAAATALLAGGARLLTVTGPGGVGKTRLALAVAVGLGAAFPDGVAFVDLAPLRDPRLVPAAMARAVRLRESGGQSARELLLAHLRPRRLLLVLDNFEHLLGAAPLLTELLEGCPSVALLITSRAALRLRGERRFPLLLLPTPPAEQPSVEAIAAAPAVRLFVERARAVAPDFALDADSAGAVAAICRRLDGLPLAIELAAARTALLRPEALLHRLERRLPLLTGGAADLPERQQSLHRTLAWSYDLLTEAEQQLFRRLAVFVGGCTLEAAEAVCGDDDHDANGVIERLGVLVDNSFVRRLDDQRGEPRFVMLETVHEYAVEQLAASGEQATVQHAHAQYMLDVALRARRGMAGRAQAAWVQRLEEEHHDLRAALTWALEAGETELALRLCAALTRFWYHRGYYREGCDWSARVLAAAPHGTPARRAAVLFGVAALTDVLHKHAEARAQIEASVALWRAAGDRRGLASSLASLGMMARHDRDWPAARQAREEALAIYAESPEPWGQRLALGVLGWVAEDEGDHATARRLLEASLAVARAGGSPIDIALQLNNLGIVAIRQGDTGEAQERHREALRLTHEVDAREPMAGALEGLAAVAAARRDGRRAAWLLGAASELRTAIGSPRIAQFEEEYGRLLPQVRADMGEDARVAAAAAGAATPLPEVVAAALAEDVSGPHAYP